MVLLSTKNLHLPGARKLYTRWVGPFKVLQRVGPVAYKLDLEGRFSSLHPTFHTSYLKPHQPGGSSGAPPEPVELDGQLEYKVEAIKAHRKRGRRLEILVQWLGYSSAHDEWLKEENLGNAQAKLRAYKQANGLS